MVARVGQGRRPARTDVPRLRGREARARRATRSARARSSASPSMAGHWPRSGDGHGPATSRGPSAPTRCAAYSSARVAPGCAGKPISSAAPSAATTAVRPGAVGRAGCRPMRSRRRFSGGSAKRSCPSRSSRPPEPSSGDGSMPPRSSTRLVSGHGSRRGSSSSESSMPGATSTTLAYQIARDETRLQLARLPDDDRVRSFDAHRTRLLALPEAIDLGFACSPRGALPDRDRAGRGARPGARGDHLDGTGPPVLRKTAGVPPRGFEPLISTLKGWRPRPLDDGGGRRRSLAEGPRRPSARPGHAPRASA